MNATQFRMSTPRLAKRSSNQGPQRMWSSKPCRLFSTVRAAQVHAGAVAAAVRAPTQRADTTAIVQKAGTGQIKLTEENEHMCNVDLTAVVEGAAEEVWDIMTLPDSPVQRAPNMEQLYRRVLEDDGQGRCKLEVGSRINLRAMGIIPLSFEIHVARVEDKKNHVICAELIESGMLSQLKLRWTVQPLSAGQQQAAPSPHALLGYAAGSGCAQAAPAPRRCLVTLQQSVSPRAALPPGMKSKFRADCAKDQEATLDRLLKELSRRRELALAAAAGGDDDELNRRREMAAAAVAADTIDYDDYDDDGWSTGPSSMTWGPTRAALPLLSPVAA